MLGKLAWKEQADSGLDLAGGDGGSLVVLGEVGSFTSNATEHVVDQGIHDAHGLAGDASVWVDLLEDFVDVDLERLFCLLGLLAWLAAAFSWCWFLLADHFVLMKSVEIRLVFIYTV